MEKQTETDSEYEPLTPTLDETGQYQFVYCVNQGYLPSHISKVVLVTDQIYREKDNIEVEKQHLRHCENRKCCVVIVVVVLMFLISSVISLALWKYFDSKLETDHVSQWLHIHDGDRNTSKLEADSPHNDKKIFVSEKASDSQSRSPCSKICYSYSAFRFKSKCVNGYCTCKGNGYHHLTCLPKVNGCSMKKVSNKFAVSKYKSKEQISFCCTAQTNTKISEEVHVISNFGNNYANSTILNIKDSRRNFNRPVVLVLTNYQKVHWVINIEDKINLKTVYLISNKNLRASDVKANNQISDVNTDIVKIHSQVGYGDDRNGGNTVELLERITKDIGSITTFTGSSNADHWILTLTNHYSL